MNPQVGLVAVIAMAFGALAGSPAVAVEIITEPIRQFGHPSLGESVVFDPTGERVAFSSRNNIIVRTIGETTHLVLYGHTDTVRSVVFSSDGSQILSGSKDGLAKLWDVNTAQELMTFTGHTDAIVSAVISPDGTRVMTCSEDATARIWDLNGNSTFLYGQEVIDEVKSVAFSLDGKRILLGVTNFYHDYSTVIVKDAVSLATYHFFPLSGARIQVVAISPDGTKAVAGIEDFRYFTPGTPYTPSPGNAVLFDINTKTQICRFSTSDVVTAAFSPDGGRMLIGTKDGSASLWDVDTCDIVESFPGHRGVITALDYSPDGTAIVTGSADDGTIVLWDPEDGQVRGAFAGGRSSSDLVAFSADGSRVAAISGRKILQWNKSTSDVAAIALDDFAMTVPGGLIDPTYLPVDSARILAINVTTAELRDADTGMLLHTLHGHNASISAYTLSHDGMMALTGTVDGTVRLWDTTTGNLLRTLSGHRWSVTSVTFSPDDSQVLTTSSNGIARIWDVATGEELLHYLRWDRLSFAAFSPFGHQFFTVSRSPTGNEVSLWEIDSHEPFRVFDIGQTSVFAYSSDGRHLLASGDDGMAVVWDMRTGTKRRAFGGHNAGWISNAVFSSDGSLVLTGAANGTLSLWDNDGLGSPADVDGNYVINAVDVQLVINAALGILLELGMNADINSDGVVNAIDVQLVINAALGL